MEEHLPTISKHSQKINLVLSGFLVFSLLLTTIAVSQVRSLESDAARGSGKGGGKPRTTQCTTCTVNATPNPIPLSTTSIVISGMGYSPNTTIWIATPQDIASYAVVTDATGSFAWTFNRLWHIPGQSTIKVYNNAGKYGTPLATVLVTVE